ncbi:MAG: MFS transporter [Pseudomonadota bacterium]
MSVAGVISGLGGRGVLAPILSISVVGVASAGGVPLIALTHEEAGVGPGWIGFAVACGALGIILGAQATPPLLRRLGAPRLVAACLAATALALLSFKAIESFAARCLLQTALGVASAGLFSATEFWIMAAAPPARRGRVAGAYALSLSAGFAAGPAALLLTGVGGWAPFWALAALALLAGAPLAWGRDLAPRAEAAALGPNAASSALAYARKAPALLWAAALFGALELGAGALLPVWGLGLGLTEREAVSLGLAFALGGFILQPLLAWACDRVPAQAMVRFAGAGCLLGALALLWAAAAGADQSGPALTGLLAVLFLWGGVSAGLYIAALVAIGGEAGAGGASLAAGAAALVAGYGLGAPLASIAAPIASGPSSAPGLPAAIALAAAAYLLLAWRAARPAAP